MKGHDVYKLQGVECPICQEKTSVRLLVPDDHSQDTVIVCKKCARELNDEVFQNQLCELISALCEMAQDGELNKESFYETVTEKLDLDWE
jgi:transcription elongation factor Elf1